MGPDLEAVHGIREVRLGVYWTGGDEAAERAKGKEPSYTEPYVLWCRRAVGANPPAIRLRRKGVETALSSRLS